MQVQSIQKVLPALREPTDAGYVHLTNEALNREVAYCGYRRVKGQHRSHGYEAPALACPCGAPVCPTCMAVRRTYDQTGAWEGPDDRR